jgi:chaperonin GroES
MLAFKTLKPLLNRVVIRKADKITKTAGGILLPEDKAIEFNYGTVLSVGPGRHSANGDLIVPTVKVGDQVLLPEYGGAKITLAEKQELYIYRDEDIMGTLHEPTK